MPDFETVRTVLMYVFVAAALIAIAVVFYKSFTNTQEGMGVGDAAYVSTWILAIANILIPIFGATMHSTQELKGVAAGMVFLALTNYAMKKEKRALRIACLVANAALFICFLSVYPNKP